MKIINLENMNEMKCERAAIINEIRAAQRRIKKLQIEQLEIEVMFGEELREAMQCD